ncbi:hypothetical protein HPB49_006597 [Dermacentor silvarum]|uniref:Uncharacterized protein n=1 Tax=Dermacentor silvarum TaxID=543639 RepID=A0ACB8DWI8_DERSI|nr:hypothetical protein HPB49_006597 [Dermacentor silvarum]
MRCAHETNPLNPLQSAGARPCGTRQARTETMHGPQPKSALPLASEAVSPHPNPSSSPPGPPSQEHPQTQAVAAAVPLDDLPPIDTTLPIQDRLTGLEQRSLTMERALRALPDLLIQRIGETIVPKITAEVLKAVQIWACSQFRFKKSLSRSASPNATPRRRKLVGTANTPFNRLIQWNCRGFRNRQKRSHLLLFLQSRGSLPAVLAPQEAVRKTWGTARLTDWPAFRTQPFLPLSSPDGYSAWAAHALSTQRSHTRVIQTTQAAPAVDPHLLHLWDARRGLLCRWRRHKLNRKLKARIAALTEEAAAYAAHLSDTNWVETCTKAAGQMGSSGTWRLFRSLLDPSSTRGETQRQLRRALHGFPGTSAQLADKLRDRYLCHTVDLPPY